MRRSGLVLFGAVLLLIGAAACGGNTVVDGLPGPFLVPTSGSGASGSSTSASSSGTGGASCLSCSARLPQIFMGVQQTTPTCPGMDAMAEQVFLSCACSGPCQMACATNICTGTTLTPDCQKCTEDPASCANQLAACASN